MCGCCLTLRKKIALGVGSKEQNFYLMMCAQVSFIRNSRGYIHECHEVWPRLMLQKSKDNVNRRQDISERTKP